MDATAEENPKVNGEVDLADSLRGWAADLADAAKAYKGASGQDGLLLRSKISASAKQIINAIKEPGETCFEYSVQVRSEILQNCFLAVCLLPVDGGNGRAPYAHGAQNLRQDSSAGKHILPGLGRKCWR